MIISFKFSVFELEIEHKILTELGEFTIFCMKAISSDMKIKDISNIIQLKKKIIKNQLSFAISRKYLTANFILTEKGIEVVKLFEFINNFNQRKVKIALEHYIENDSKLLYSPDNKKFDDNATGYLVEDNLYDYKIQNKFDEIIEKDKSKIKDYILVDFDNYQNTIERYLNDFIFKINKNEKQKFYNYKINESDFINELGNVQNKTNNSISIDIPILEVNKTITSDILDREHIDKIKSKFDKYKYFNLIDGQLIELGNQKKKFNDKKSNLKIESLISKKNTVESNLNNQDFQLNDLLYVNMKTEIKEFYKTKFFDITKIMDNI